MKKLRPQLIRPQLKRDDYLNHALKILSSEGITAITIEQLSADLGVTRGSFYHHFKNRQDLLDEMIDYWVQHWTVEVLQEVEDLKLDPSNTLLVLMRTIRRHDAARYEIAMRNWAQRDKNVRCAIRKVDKLRLDFIRLQYCRFAA